jgi:hypothetical protein
MYDARARLFGFDHGFALWDRSFALVAFHYRTQKDPDARRAFDAWLAGIDEEAGPSASEMWTTMVGILLQQGVPEAALRMARRALELARNAADETAARLEIGHCLTSCAGSSMRRRCTRMPCASRPIARCAGRRKNGWIGA